ncbi:MAG TPA: Hsp70 family protein [Anaeromyxobacteraceae bacterium]
MASGSEILLGIDLGTTFSTAAAVFDGKMQFALDARGEACFPSVVHFPKSGPPLVGVEADRLRASDPQNTVFGIKRLVGRPADSGPARLLDACSAFRIRSQGADEAAVEVRTGTYAASEVAALILRHLRERAEARFGRRIAKAVLTVPVTAGQGIRDAMVRCGRMANLEVVRILSEPCAGAVARGIGTAASDTGPVLVYDFGGGTFDATVVQRAGAQLRVLSAGGDECLGGDDLSLAFAKFVESGVYRVHGVEVSRDVVLWDRVQRQCELVKRALSTSLEARYHLADAFSGGGRPKDLDFVFHRDHLAPHWSEFVERSLEAAAQTVREAGLDVHDLAGILLIGGTTFVPQVRAGVARAFPRPYVAEDDPQTAVARGAALLAANPALLET